MKRKALLVNGRGQTPLNIRSNALENFHEFLPLSCKYVASYSLSFFDYAVNGDERVCCFLNDFGVSSDREKEILESFRIFDDATRHELNMSCFKKSSSLV
ncbi:hypothetical protein CEXT_813211 [Caerostris extrusa]|uniref:Uncharacterized protein n=1 Tax=Caerostris extrusa TaxID=172846 RepID=A0AAV4QVP7_CAEEX|nr:hypothetical protein CEXT_813211 [Caerostris extrusa]